MNVVRIVSFGWRGWSAIAGAREARELLLEPFPHEEHARQSRSVQGGERLSSFLSVGMPHHKRRSFLIGHDGTALPAPTALFHPRWAATPASEVGRNHEGGLLLFCLALLASLTCSWW